MEKKKKASLGVPITTYLWWQAVVGSAGAFAAVFGILTIGNATRAAGSSDITVVPIYLVALCVVGGFVGNRLLVRVGKNLEDQITHLAEKTEHAENLARKTNREVETKLSDVRESLSAATQAAIEAKELVNQTPKMGLDIEAAKKVVVTLERLRPVLSEPELRQKGEELRLKGAILRDGLEEYLAIFPRERVLNIVSANLSFELGYALRAEHMEALAFERLHLFIARRRSDGLPESDDDETAWFNLACYSAILTSRASEPERERLLLKSKEAFRNSLRVAQQRGTDILARRLGMKNDPELGPLITSEHGKELLDEFSRKTSAATDGIDGRSEPVQ